MGMTLLKVIKHVDDIIPKLNNVCLAIRSVKPLMSLEVIKFIYFSYIHSVLSYGIIFWGNSVHSKYSFKIQRRTIRIITNAGISDLCWDLFKKWQILPFYSQYIHSLLMFVVKNTDLFKLNSDIHRLNKRHDNDFHLPSAKLKLF
jgi:hypothetical protein